MDDDGSRAKTLETHGNDAHGRAALLLVESLIHGLIARSSLSVSEAVEIVQIAIEVSEDANTAETSSGSDQLLNSIRASLMHDIRIK